ncbi:hypothetical protein V6N12_049945 [Hibiscus sabdariffa]|uniref:ATPase AAA-type core domain-containing protein n=1 Tax=Hibiscus sabdariffa TaxID=183260 RepID=A0ABR2GBW9_9ROSI
MAASMMVPESKPSAEPLPPATRSDLGKQLKFIDIQEEYVKDEQKNLKRAFEGLGGSQADPVGAFGHKELLKPSASVALHRHSNALVDVLPPEVDSSISLLSQSEKPDVTYNPLLITRRQHHVLSTIVLLHVRKNVIVNLMTNIGDIGGCDIQKQEIREAVELPLTHHELYKQIGIDPPRGVLLYENAPAIIFIDEVDAIATARFDAQTRADREVQRILMELLNQMDGFDQTVNVKVIMATNRADTLDPTLLRPRRLD